MPMISSLILFSLIVLQLIWMTTTILHDWFQKFVEKMEKMETTPILLVFEDHMTHLSLANVQLAKAENVSLVRLIKLPAHCTDVLQPLDVSCFR